MRSSISASVVALVVTAGACGGNVLVDGPATGGHGGSTTIPVTTGTGTTSPGTTSSGMGAATTTSVSSSSSSSSGDPCSTGTDCTICPDFGSCYMCYGAMYPEGFKLYEDVVSCIFCDACYTVCEGPMQGCAQPATKDACDVGTPSNPGTGACGDGSNGCISCAQKSGSLCYGKLTACHNDPQCTGFGKATQTCPMN